MNPESHLYVCPETKAPLTLADARIASDQVISGRLVSPSGAVYPIEDGIPDLTFPRALSGAEKEARDYYDGVADHYDDVAHLTFRIQYCNEDETRADFAKLLQLKPDARVLELACGTGRDSVHIARHLDSRGQYCLSDLSRSMLLRCRQKLQRCTVPTELSVSNSCHLPFPDGWFDAVFSFGGLGVFGDPGQGMREMARVTKAGGRVVTGDESMPPWLHETEYGRILLNNNPLFKKPIPFELIPVEARDVVVRWVVGGVYYLIEFTVGMGEPKADFDLEIPGQRGGTLRTRYHGKLEGVTPEAREMVRKASLKSGKSVHRWLDEVVRKAAEAQLDGQA